MTKFNLTLEEQRLTKELQQIITDKIILNDGVIPFSHYMELALYYPSLGYYNNNLYKFGKEGDFITAPMISNLFGYSLAQQIGQLFSVGVEPNILEFGAGNGQLMVDILNSFGENLNNYYILELSANLINWQKETLIAKAPQFLNKVIWLTALPEEFNGVILANEVLDAQPCEVVKFTGDKIQQLGVTKTKDGKFDYSKVNTTNSELIEIAKSLSLSFDNYQTEINLNNRGFIKTIAHCLKVGAVILIDYGYGQKEYYHEQKSAGTLRGFFRQHKIDHIFTNIGLMDITSSVDFTAIAHTGISNGLDFIGYSNQGSFLLNCGIIDTLTHIKKELNDEQYQLMSNRANKLIAQNELGDLFKVIGFSKGVNFTNWLGFSHGDRSSSL